MTRKRTRESLEHMLMETCQACDGRGVVKTAEKNTVKSGAYYIQVGSFATYSPAKKFLNKITNRGYTYTFHKVTRKGKTLNKVLVGPFKTQSAAREALPVIKRNVISGAFLIKL